MLYLGEYCQILLLRQKVSHRGKNSWKKSQLLLVKSYYYTWSSKTTKGVPKAKIHLYPWVHCLEITPPQWTSDKMSLYLLNCFWCHRTWTAKIRICNAHELICWQILPSHSKAFLWLGNFSLQDFIIRIHNQYINLRQWARWLMCLSCKMWTSKLSG